MSVNNITLENISTINLQASDIGGQLNERLTSIQTNFQSIVNQNYLKGRQGESIITTAVILTEDSDLLDTFVDLICANLPGEEDYQKEQKDRVRQNIIGKEIVTIQGTNEDTYMSAIPFVYKDNTDSTNISNPEDYLDLSCILYYDHIEGAWKKINTFPTIYFDDEKQKFCWNINGVKTQLPAEGVPGPIGLKGSSMILAETEKRESGTANAIIKRIFITGEEKDGQGVIKYKGKWTEVDSLDPENMGLRDDCVVLLHDISKNAANSSGRWLFSNLKIVKSEDGSLQYQAITDPSGELSLASIFAYAEGYLTMDDITPVIAETEKKFTENVDEGLELLKDEIQKQLNSKVDNEDFDEAVRNSLENQIDNETGIFSIRPEYWDWEKVLEASNNKCYLARDSNGYGWANPYDITMPSIAQATIGEESTVQTSSVIFKVIMPRYYMRGGTTYETNWGQFNLDLGQAVDVDRYIVDGSKMPISEKSVSSDSASTTDKFELVFTGYCFQIGDECKNIWILDSTLLTKKS